MEDNYPKQLNGNYIEDEFDLEEFKKTISKRKSSARVKDKDKINIFSLIMVFISAVAAYFLYGICQHVINAISDYLRMI